MIFMHAALLLTACGCDELCLTDILRATYCCKSHELLPSAVAFLVLRHPVFPAPPRPSPLQLVMHLLLSLLERDSAAIASDAANTAASHPLTGPGSALGSAALHGASNPSGPHSQGSPSGRAMAVDPTSLSCPPLLPPPPPPSSAPLSLSLAGHGSALVSEVVAAVDGERDPRCLLLSFRIVRQLVVVLRGGGPGGQAVLSDSAEELFDVIACYFPISFVPVRRRGPRGSCQEDDAGAALPALTADCLSIALSSGLSVAIFSPFSLSLSLPHSLSLSLSLSPSLYLTLSLAAPQ